MKKTARKNAMDVPFTKDFGHPQNGFVPVEDSPFDLQNEHTPRNMEKKKNQCLVITLPESLTGLPVRIETSPNCPGVALNLIPQEGDGKKYLFIWNQSDYLKVERDDILWIEAAGSYSVIHFRNSRPLTVSFNLSTVARDLPADDFIRIHRSYIVNMKNVGALSGNCLWVGDKSIAVGREYRKMFFKRFSFIGSRKNVENE